MAIRIVTVDGRLSLRNSRPINLLHRPRNIHGSGTLFDYFDTQPRSTGSYLCKQDQMRGRIKELNPLLTRDSALGIFDLVTATM